jgi:hypothetical protein
VDIFTNAMKREHDCPSPACSFGTWIYDDLIRHLATHRMFSVPVLVIEEEPE